MSYLKSEGHRTSERKACYHAFYAALILAGYGICEGVDLSDLGVLIGAVVLPLMWYAGARTAYKINKKERP